MYYCRVNLLELAQIMKDHGAVNAINLDGGGSATFAVNGTVVNYPSDTWYFDLCKSIYHQLSSFYHSSL